MQKKKLSFQGWEGSVLSSQRLRTTNCCLLVWFHPCKCRTTNNQSPPKAKQWSLSNNISQHLEHCPSRSCFNLDGSKGTHTILEQGKQKPNADCAPCSNVLSTVVWYTSTVFRSFCFLPHNPLLVNAFSDLLTPGDRIIYSYVVLVLSLFSKNRIKVCMSSSFFLNKKKRNGLFGIASYSIHLYFVE